MSNKNSNDPAIEEWAKEAVSDLIFRCVLNIRLRNAGLCPMYIAEMNQSDLEDYCQLVVDLHTK